MATALASKETCFFVGGNGTKAGAAIAGGCTRAWLESKGMNPASLFGENGGCKYTAVDLEISEDGIIIGSAGQFIGIEPGMVAYIYCPSGTSGMYEVTAVSANGDTLTFGGWTPEDSETITIYVGGAFNGLYQAMFYSSAYWYDCTILTNKDETITATMDLRFNGGNTQRNTVKRIVGYNSSLFLVNGRIVSDMDCGQGHYQSAESRMQNGFTAGSKITISGSGFSGVAVSWKVDNFELRNLRIVGNAGGSCLQPASGTMHQYKGLVLNNCAFESGMRGLYSDGMADFVLCQDCYAAASVTGWGFTVQDIVGNGRSAVFVDCIADSGSGFTLSSGIIRHSVGRNNTVGVSINGAVSILNSLFYNITGAAFECSNALARWQIDNTIVVMSNTATYGVFRVQSVGGNVVYEDYNCFVRLDGTAAVYHYTANWPVLYYPSKIGTHTIQVNPCFQDPVSGNFRLMLFSPCLNAGRPTLGGGFSSIGVQQKIQIPARNVMYGANNRLYGN
jgi:hypothetical protein